MGWSQVVPMFSIHDTMQQLRCDISTVTYGIALGMAGFVAASGTRVCTRSPLHAMCRA